MSRFHTMCQINEDNANIMRAFLHDSDVPKGLSNLQIGDSFKLEIQLCDDNPSTDTLKTIKNLARLRVADPAAHKEIAKQIRKWLNLEYLE